MKKFAPIVLVTGWAWSVANGLAGSFDGDVRADIGVYWPGGGNWYIESSSEQKLLGGSAQNWGWSATDPVPGDFDGDGKDDLAVFHAASGSWFVRRSSDGLLHGGAALNLGAGGTIPVPGDFDGDGRDDPTVFVPMNGTWYSRLSSSAQYRVQQWGWNQTIPAPGDYDGDGRADVAVFFPGSGTWFIQQSASGQQFQQQWGWSETVPMPMDYDGDGKTDIAVFHQKSATWCVRQSSSGQLIQQQWGWSESLPCPGDFDGDGKADLAVYFPGTGTWYIRQSSTGLLLQRQWGWSEALPSHNQLRINRAFSGISRSTAPAATDSDHDGLVDLDELNRGSSTSNPDTDGDGLGDGEEVDVYGTDPTIPDPPGPPSSISGSVTYRGSSPGPIVVLASGSRFAWSSDWRTTIAGSGAFTLSGMPSRRKYWLKAFRDFNNNGARDPNEPTQFWRTQIHVPEGGASGIGVVVEKQKGMRVDFGEYYGGMWSGKSTKAIAAEIVADAADWGVNTLYVRAMNPVYGTFWANPTSPYLTAEGGHGKNGILGELVSQAHARGLKVIAWLQPVNGCIGAWNAKPEWRYRNLNGSDYAPATGHFYWLSPFSEDAMNWLSGVVQEVLNQGVDGIDFAESDFAEFSDNPLKALTYDSSALAVFRSRFPAGRPGDANWFRLRKEILTTNLYGRLIGEIHARGKEAHVTAIWGSSQDGFLRAESVIALNTGFSFQDILNLPEIQRPDMVSPEMIWQREAASEPWLYPAMVNPEWTVYAAATFASFVGNRSLAGMHPEITRKTVRGQILPSLDQFRAAVSYALDNASGCDFFVHHLARQNHYLPNGANPNSYGYWAVSNVFRYAP